ncbi:hypothetical protein AK812_SmicGene48479, partial [Symbiodinium microadriaticum]
THPRPGPLRRSAPGGRCSHSELARVSSGRRRRQRP